MAARSGGDGARAPLRDPKIDAVQGRLDTVADVMRTNIERSLSNADRIADVDTKTEAPARSAHGFAERATSVRRTMCCRHCKERICVIAIALCTSAIAILVVRSNLKQI